MGMEKGNWKKGKFQEAEIVRTWAQRPFEQSPLGKAAPPQRRVRERLGVPGDAG
jgi:hypothetical protein